MAARTAADVKGELEAERERLGAAVHTLRGEADRWKRRLPFVALAVVGVAVAVAVVRHRASEHRAPETRGRGRARSFLDRD